MTPTEFEHLAQRALEDLPDEFKPYVANVMLSIQKRPSRAVLEELELGPDEDLFGLYDGPSIEEQSNDLPEMPPRVILYYEPLLEACGDDDELRHEIQTTVLHEIGHHFGIDEDRLAELGYE